MGKQRTRTGASRVLHGAHSGGSGVERGASLPGSVFGEHEPSIVCASPTAGVLQPDPRCQAQEEPTNFFSF